MSVNIDIREDGYPLLESGKVIFGKLVDPIKEVVIDCSVKECVSSYVADGILMDTGSGGTLLPHQLALVLGILEPPEDTKSWLVIRGLGGINIGYIPEEPISLIIEGKFGERCEYDISPVVYLGCAPVFSAIEEHLRSFEEHRFPKSIVRYVTIPYEMCKNGFYATVRAPAEECSLLKKRPTLSDPQTCSGLQMIIIGRDWQSHFRLRFQEKNIRID